MADPQRLQQLRAQRDLIARHLAWLDAEIAHTQADASSSRDPASDRPLAPAPASPAVPVAGLLQRQPAQSDPFPSPASDPDQLLAELAHEEATKSDRLSKSGCWLIFVAVLLLCSAATAAVVFLIYR